MDIGSAHGINSLANPIILIKAKGNLISSDFQSIEFEAPALIIITKGLVEI